MFEARFANATLLKRILDAIKELVAAYKSNDFRSFVEKDPKTVGFSKPDYWR